MKVELDDVDLLASVLMMVRSELELDFALHSADVLLRYVDVELRSGVLGVRRSGLSLVVTSAEVPKAAVGLPKDT